ncbi:MAG: putative toxin-antitoxin system toxin component, PIN family [Terriglobales bacterium]|jgi:putative PIN family toxin of toxin-antitoxin system
MDTAVLVAAFRSDVGASRRVLKAALQRRFPLLLSAPLMLEYEAVLCRPEHLAASGATVEEVREVLDGMAAVAKQIRFAFRWWPALRDPKDDMVLETAINGGAHAIITLNKRDFIPIAVQFGCAVTSPGDFLRELERRNQDR